MRSSGRKEGRKDGRKEGENRWLKVKDGKLKGQWREEDEEGGYDIGSRLLALSLQIRAVGQDTV